MTCSGTGKTYASAPELDDELKNAYLHSFDEASFENEIQVLEGRFVSKEEEYQEYKKIDIIESAITEE